MEFGGKVAVITGAASGIGRAVATALAHRGVRAIALVDMGEAIEDVAASVNADSKRQVAYPFRGDTTDADFRTSVFDQMPRALRAGLDVRSRRRHHSRRTGGTHRPARRARRAVYPVEKSSGSWSR